MTDHAPGAPTIEEQIEWVTLRVSPVPAMRRAILASLRELAACQSRIDQLEVELQAAYAANIQLGRLLKECEDEVASL